MDVSKAQVVEALRPRTRINDAERTKHDIIEAATEEFATNGLSGGRVDAIAARTRTTKRMIYYYFGSKEGLYIAVLEKAYGNIRAHELRLHVDLLEPVAAISRLVEFTFDYQDAHPDFVRLVSIENIHRAEYIAQSSKLRTVNAPIIDTIDSILKRGRSEGVFTSQIEAFDLHVLISSFCYFRVSNRYTLGAIFGRDVSEPVLRARHKRMLTDAIVALLEAPEAGTA
jgi:AcrR family transcriptional regulator